MNEFNKITSEINKLENNNYFDNLYYPSAHQIVRAMRDSTTLIKVHGEKYSRYYINDGDIIAIDIEARISDKMQVLVSMNGELSIKLFRKIDNVEYLQTDGNQFLPMSIAPYIEYKVIGAVAGIIHNFDGRNQNYFELNKNKLE